MIDETEPAADAMLTRVLNARALVQALGYVPREPSLLYQDPDTKAVSCRPIGDGLRIGRWSREQDAQRGADLAFPGLANMSRPHFEVRVEDGFHMLISFGRAGTQINGCSETVKEHFLRSGDLIYAAGASFIYTGGSDDCGDPDEPAANRAAQ